VDYDTPITGRTIDQVESAGKWLRIYLSGDLILVTHMLMSGSWHIYRPGETWKRSRAQMRVALYTGDFVAVAFSVPIAEFHTAATLERHRSVQKLGPDVLAPEFDEDEAIRQLRTRPDLEVGVAVLRQHLVAGMGNVFKSEVCFASGVNPFRLIGSLNTWELQALMHNARRFLQNNVLEKSGAPIVTYSGLRRTTNSSNPSDRLWVYHRSGEPCRRCKTPILSRKQGDDARTTFWCPSCQPLLQKA
jgi:endonuclease-8